MDIFAPGDGTVLDHISMTDSKTTIYHEILVRLNRPITENNEVGFIYHVNDDANSYYIDLPHMSKMKSATVLANKHLFTIPQKIEKGSTLSIRTFLANKGDLVNTRFSTLEQILELDEVTYISEPIKVKLSPQ